MKQHKAGSCLVLGRPVVFPTFYADFCLCPEISDYHPFTSLISLILTFKNIGRGKISTGKPYFPQKIRTSAKFARKNK